ncbi:Mitogen-activated protein kinase kinase kinase 3 [Diplonema papillatum]|nr:Mitogen-activated protein kinase kinase kinase 3 [Diplonema papillatum]
MKRHDAHLVLPGCAAPPRNNSGVLEYMSIAGLVCPPSYPSSTWDISSCPTPTNLQSLLVAKSSYFTAFQESEPHTTTVAPTFATDFRRNTQRRKKRSRAHGRYRRGKKLGEGATGTVYQGIDQLLGMFVAIKHVKASYYKQVKDEFGLLQKLDHPNIVRYYDFEVMRNGSLQVYLELVDGGSLSDLLAQFGKFPEPVLMNYTRQIVEGLDYLHKRRVLHRDIKPANLLVSTDGIVKLTDFGTSHELATQVETVSDKEFVGTPAYTSPEAIRGVHSFASDIWSMGITIAELATGVSPWKGVIEYEGAIDFMMKLSDGAKAYRPKLPPDDRFSPEFIHFLDCCTLRDPGDRSTLRALREHPFLTEEVVDFGNMDRLQSCFYGSTDYTSLSTGPADPEPEAPQPGGMYSTHTAGLVTPPKVLSPVDAGPPGFRAERAMERKPRAPEQEEEQGEEQGQGDAEEGAEQHLVKAESFDTDGASKREKFTTPCLTLLPPSGSRRSVSADLVVSPVDDDKQGYDLRGVFIAVRLTNWQISNTVVEEKQGSPYSFTPRRRSPSTTPLTPNNNDLTGTPRNFVPATHALPDQSEVVTCTGAADGLITLRKNDLLKPQLEERSPALFTTCVTSPSTIAAQQCELSTSNSSDTDKMAMSLSDGTRRVGQGSPPHQRDMRKLSFNVPHPPPHAADADLLSNSTQGQSDDDDDSDSALQFKFDMFFNEESRQSTIYTCIVKPLLRVFLADQSTYAPMRRRSSSYMSKSSPTRGLPARLMSLTLTAMPYTDENTFTVGSDTGAGIVPAIVTDIFARKMPGDTIYISSACATQEKHALYDNIHRRCLDDPTLLSSWQTLGPELRVKVDSAELAATLLDFAPLSFTGVQSPHLFVIELANTDKIVASFFINILYGLQWAFWVDGLSHTINRCFSDNDDESDFDGTVKSFMSTTTSPRDSEKYYHPLMTTLEEVYQDTDSLNYVLHSFHTNVDSIQETEGSLGVLSQALFKCSA